MKHLKRIFENSKHKVYYGFVQMPNYWADDNDTVVDDQFFIGKKWDEYEFDNFQEMDRMVGHPSSLFGTRGLMPGDPKRTSKSFDRYNQTYGPCIVRIME